MFNELKKDYLFELKEQLVTLQEEKNKNVETIRLLNDKEIELVKAKSNIPHDEKYIQFENTYSKICKLFNKKKYDNEKQELCAAIREEYDTKIEDNRNRKNEVEKRQQEIEEEVIRVGKNVQAIENANSIMDFHLSYDEAKEILLKNNVNLFNYSFSEIFQLGSSIETTGNIEFMRRAINENVFNIIYDQTKDFDMYYNLIMNLKYDKNDESEKDLFNEQKNTMLEMMQKSKNGEIIITPEELIEGICFYFKDSILSVNNTQRETKASGVLTNIYRVTLSALELSESDYRELEKMYNPEENNYYCHQTGGIGLEDAIFREGLRMSAQGSGPKHIGLTARKIDSLLGIAGYKNFYAGNGAGDARIIVEIPKEVDRPIGSNQLDGATTYILPEYVVCSLYSKPTINNEGSIIDFAPPVLHKNNCQDKIQYQYLYKDWYDRSNPNAIENPDYAVDENKGIGL